MKSTLVKSNILPMLSPDSNYTKILERFVRNMDATDLTKQLYKKRMEYFFVWMTEEQILKPDREHILEYKKQLKSRGLQANSIGSYLVAIRSFFEWANNQGIYPNIAANIRGAKRSKGFRRDALTLSQTKNLLGSVNRKSMKDLRDLALINLLVRTGLRTIEVVRADIEDLRQVSSESLGLWVQGKGHDAKDQYVVLIEDCVEPLMAYLTARGNVSPGDPLFASTSDGNRGARLSTRTIRKIVKTRMRDISINHPRLSAHSLRHTAVSLSLAAGATLIEAQQMARHTSPETTMIYAHGLERAKGHAEKRLEDILKKSSDSDEP